MNKIMKQVRYLLLSVLLILSILTMSSCFVLGYESSSSLTKEDVQQMMNNTLAGNVTVEGGDNYEITINGAMIDNAVAGKTLLSAVSIRCTFKVTTTGSIFQPGTTKEQTSAGSGVIYKLDKERGDAYIITNYHVVYDVNSQTTNGISNDIRLYLYGQEHEDYAIPATYVGGSMLYDIAVLKVTGSRVLAESNATVVSFADSDEVSVLDKAIAVGNPEALGISATLGYINVDSEYIKMNAMDGSGTMEIRVMRIDTAVNSGNSGGGLFNSSGELIGIVNAKLTSSESMSYALPSNFVKYVADNILYYCDGTSYENVYRCYLGVTVTQNKMYTVYDKETGKVYKREEVVVSETSAGSLAEGCLQAGDIINHITIDGVKYETLRLYSITDPMLNARVGSKVITNVTRGTETIDVEITITNNALAKIQ